VKDKMNVAVITIFPGMFDAFVSHGIIRRAIESGKICIDPVDVRDYAHGRHRVTDDRPYGGGSGMVMKPEPLAKAIEAAKEKLPKAKTILMTPQGRRFDQLEAQLLAKSGDLILVCGRYEGIDERFCETCIDDELSLGDFVLTGGELAAMVIMDAVIRLLPGILGNSNSPEADSFSDGLLEHAQYTRPPRFEGIDVPEVLLSGHHNEIKRWRLESSLARTFLKRPDLLEDRQFSSEEKAVLKKWCRDLESLLRKSD
jgi:tRNA (guanine37-N1)-methyltransferase